MNTFEELYNEQVRTNRELLQHIEALTEENNQLIRNERSSDQQIENLAEQNNLLGQEINEHLEAYGALQTQYEQSRDLAIEQMDTIEGLEQRVADLESMVNTLRNMLVDYPPLYPVSNSK